MKTVVIALVCAGFAVPASAHAQAQIAPPPPASMDAGVKAAAIPSATVPVMGRALPLNTTVTVTPTQEISSKHVKVNEPVRFRVTNDVVQNGVVVIPTGTMVNGIVSWKTGRAVGGKSGKFEVAFQSLDLNGRNYRLRGTHRQEGKGNTAAALLASMFISGRSAVMVEGQTVNAFTDEPIAY